MIIPIVIGAFSTVTKGLLKGLEDLEVGGQVEIIQTTALLKMARIMRRVLETCCHSNSKENTYVKNSQGVNNDNNIGCLNIHGTHVTANNSTNNILLFFFISDLKIVYYNNY